MNNVDEYLKELKRLKSETHESIKAAASLACTAPVITSFSDTKPTGSGIVTFAWNAIAGAKEYTIQRQDGSKWKEIATTSSTSFKGSDSSNDPNWRVYVSKGSCKPIPGPATILDP